MTKAACTHYVLTALFEQDIPGVFSSRTRMGIITGSQHSCMVFWLHPAPAGTDRHRPAPAGTGRLLWLLWHRPAPAGTGRLRLVQCSSVQRGGVHPLQRGEASLQSQHTRCITTLG